MITIYHNQRCGKSRNGLSLLEEKGLDFEVIKYLETPPTTEELTLLLEKLSLEPLDLVRKKEKIWIENFKNQPLTNQEIIEAMVANPILIERPIIIKNKTAIIGRDLDVLTAFLEEPNS